MCYRCEKKVSLSKNAYIIRKLWMIIDGEEVGRDGDAKQGKKKEDFIKQNGIHRLKTL